MLIKDLLYLDCKQDEAEYYKHFCKIISKNLETSHIWIEAESFIPYNHVVSYEYTTKLFRSKTLLTEELKQDATYCCTFTYRNRSITIAFYTNKRLDDALTQILHHYVNYFEMVQELMYANNDELTGVRNRKCFSHHLATATSIPAIILIDIDNFKDVNDTYGHLEGDRVLEVFGKLLLAECGSLFSPYRYGGDEFVIVAEKYLPKEDVLNLATRISQNFSKTEVATNLGLSISIGICHEEDFGETCIPCSTSYADKALYLSKYLGKNRITVATPANILMFDIRNKLHNLWLTLERHEVYNSLIFINCNDKESAKKMCSHLKTSVRKLDMISSFEKYILILFDNCVTEATFTAKYGKLLSECVHSFTYLDIVANNNYYTLLQSLSEEILNE